MSKYLLNTFVLASLLIFYSNEVLAGPGGQIAKAIFRTFWGKVLLAVLGIVLLPLILYIYFREAIASRRAMALLKNLGMKHRQFEWFTLKNRITEVFNRVHRAWSHEDMSEAAQWVTHWYWQNQQLAHLERWKEQGLVNKCDVKQIKSIKPLFVQLSGSPDGEGSRVVASITANMEDYLQEIATGKIVEGATGYDDVETVWTFQLTEGKWLLENIEQNSMSLAYAKLMKPAGEVLQESVFAKQS